MMFGIATILHNGDRSLTERRGGPRSWEKEYIYIFPFYFLFSQRFYWTRKSIRNATFLFFFRLFEHLRRDRECEKFWALQYCVIDRDVRRALRCWSSRSSLARFFLRLFLLNRRYLRQNCMPAAALYPADSPPPFVLARFTSPPPRGGQRCAERERRYSTEW